MIKYCLDKWNENKDTLKEVLANDTKLNDCEYIYLVELVVEYILGDNWDKDNITVINNGDYQGTLLFLIPKDTYQPAEYEYLMTFVNYGSCSGCDTLQHIQSWNDGKLSEEQLKDFMSLCKDLVCNMIKPFNCGWRNEEEFEVVGGAE